MRKTDTPETVEQIEIRAFDPLNLVEALHPSAGRPAHHPLVANLRVLTAPKRGMLGGLAVHVFERHKQPGDIRRQVQYLAARLGETLAAMSERTKTGGHGHDLSRYYVEDDEERQAWRQLRLALQGPALLNSFLGQELLGAFAAAGDLRRTLRAKRAEIDQLLDQLGDEPESAA